MRLANGQFQPGRESEGPSEFHEYQRILALTLCLHASSSTTVETGASLPVAAAAWAGKMPPRKQPALAAVLGRCARSTFVLTVCINLLFARAAARTFVS
jgi:hypothetical protein